MYRQLNRCLFSIVKRFRKDDNGSIMTFAALTMPVMMLSTAVTLQYSMTVSAGKKVQHWTDSALMAGAVEANKLDSIEDAVAVQAELEKYADKFLDAGFSETSQAIFKSREVTYDPKTKVAKIEVSYQYPTIMDTITGDQQKTYLSEAEVVLSSKEKNPISMHLVLDKSGSMDWDARGRNVEDDRMKALKQAVASLTAQMASLDPEKKYVRMGAVAFDSRKYYRNVKMNWDPQTVNAYTQSLRPGGGTNSTSAMKHARNQFKNKKEEKQHEKKNSGKLKKFILFLTDGANNRSSYDTQTKKQCKNAKKDGVEIYTIAFMAPTSAQKLLKDCASSTSHYFEAENSSELIASFQAIGDEATKDLAFSK